jgi:hypothetical protein
MGRLRSYAKLAERDHFCGARMFKLKTEHRSAPLSLQTLAAYSNLMPVKKRLLTVIADDVDDTCTPTKSMLATSAAVNG